VAETVALSGVNPKTLHYWDRSGFLGPSVQEAHGTGSRRRYSFRDLVALRVAHDLRERGVSLQGLRRVVEFLRSMEGLEQPLAETYLVTDGTDVFIRRGDVAISALRQPGQHYLAFVLDLSQAVGELHAQVAALRRAS
jgi:DNA-binding transcriptional MerR regulator